MKRETAIIITLLAAVLPLAAQMAVSHTPTAMPPASGPGATVALTPVGKPVARVNGTVMTDRDLVREMYSIFPYARQHNGVPKAMEEDIRKGAMKMMEFEELVYQEAVRRGMTVAPARMQKAEVEFRKQFTSPDQYQQVVNSDFHGSQTLLREKIRRSLLIDDLLKAEVEGKSVVSVAQAKAYFLKNQNRFRTPESYAIQTISILPPATANPEQLKEARKRADDAIKQAKATTTYNGFGALAEKVSEDDWRVMMGDRQAMDITKLPPEVTKVIQSMKIGQVSDLIQVGQAFTIVRLNAHIPAGMQKFETVKDSLRKEMQKNKTEQLRGALDKKLRQAAKVEEL
jgi:parvulin-like peptidyl-prolyl isomerase